MLPNGKAASVKHRYHCNICGGVGGNFLFLIKQKKSHADVFVLKKRFAAGPTVLLEDLVF